ncbi:hypothetical protein SAMN05216286_3117 [Kosakonia oryzae]|uniref:Uncharacterized protein n=1 Tax=Kosakonia oryzae TaxID=497725 RepID=A0AA94H551_9ENTR|nr:hypothetical protein SAMN05216286_3117 [Kosakonia oryzae]
MGAYCCKNGVSLQGRSKKTPYPRDNFQRSFLITP